MHGGPERGSRLVVEYGGNMENVRLPRVLGVLLYSLTFTAYLLLPPVATVDVAASVCTQVCDGRYNACGAACWNTYPAGPARDNCFDTCDDQYFSCAQHSTWCSPPTPTCYYYSCDVTCYPNYTEACNVACNLTGSGYAPCG